MIIEIKGMCDDGFNSRLDINYPRGQLSSGLTI